ncbi:MAG TPA: helix-turn-helix domain-containing protein [Gaiellaceae bacterium]|nr:helix-turn-helix domain-containing protein [Gaiellaceae bacterium]
MPKVSQEHLDARREQILEGARRCFAAHGYAGATVARLEQEIGLSRGAIFNYFEGKQALFVAVAMRVNDRFQRIFVEQGLEEAIRGIAAEDPAWLRVLIETQTRLHHDPEFIRRFEAAAEEVPRVSTRIAELQQAGVFRDDLPATGVAHFLGMVVNGLALRVAGEEETDVDSTLALLRDALTPRQ